MTAALLLVSSPVLVGTVPAHTGESIVLSLVDGAASGEATLQWTGEPVFQVYRSGHLGTINDPASKVAETLARSWNDTLTGGAMTYYHVASRDPTVPERITIELTRPNGDPVGRPLPVAGHWNTGRETSSHTGWDPDFVLDYLDAGEYVIPTFNILMPPQAQEPWSSFESGLARSRSHGIPIAIRFTQWDRLFADDPKYFNLPPADNPNVIDAADGTTIIPKTDPDGPVTRWQEVGTEWGGLPIVADMQAAYPDPPLVIWLNNFEQPRLRWEEAETSRPEQVLAPGRDGRQRCLSASLPEQPLSRLHRYRGGPQLLPGGQRQSPAALEQQHGARRLLTGPRSRRCPGPGVAPLRLRPSPGPARRDHHAPRLW